MQKVSLGCKKITKIWKIIFRWKNLWFCDTKKIQVNFIL